LASQLNPVVPASRKLAEEAVEIRDKTSPMLVISGVELAELKHRQPDVAA